MPQHREIDPNDCEMCRRVFSALEERQAATPDQPLTTEELGRVCGLKKRATQNHLAHLFEHARIDADRRTPLPGSNVGQPVLPGAQTWAKGIAAPDPTCARCLIAMAGNGWEGQLHMQELADLVGISLSSVYTHRAHLVRADLLRFVPDTHTDQVTGRVSRRTDRYTLLSGMPAAKLTGQAHAAAEDLAVDIVRSVRWFTEATDDERLIAEQSVKWILQNGWPADDVRRVLDASKDRNVYKPGGYMHALLRKMMGKQYILPARQVYTGDLPLRTAECPTCQAPFKTQKPGTVWCSQCAAKRDFDQPTPARLIRIA